MQGLDTAKIGPVQLVIGVLVESNLEEKRGEGRFGVSFLRLEWSGGQADLPTCVAQSTTYK